MQTHKNIRLLAWFNFMLDFRLYGPIAILYYTQVSGSFALGMSVFSITMLTSSLFEVPTGVFSDMIGRKKTMVYGAAASVASVSLYAVGDTYWMLVAGAICEGLARAFFSGNNEALLHDTLAESDQEAQYQEFLGKTGSTSQVALAISAITGGVIASVSYPATLWLSVIPQTLNLIISLRFVEPHTYTQRSGNIYNHLREAFTNTVQNRKLRTLSAASIIGYALGETTYQFRSAFINLLWPVWALGIAQTLGNSGAAISFYWSGRLIKRHGEFKLLTTGITYSNIVNIIALIFPTVLSPILMGSTSLFFGVNSVAVGGLMQREFTAEQRATMGSLTAFVGSIAFAIWSFVLGLMADRIGPINALLISQILSMIPLWLYWKAFRVRASPFEG